MKIIIPILEFGRAGGYRVLSKLADELILLGNRVEFLCPDESALPYYPTKATISWINEKGKTTTVNMNSEKKGNAFSIQRKLAHALKNIPKNTFDVIIANHSLTVLPIKRAGLLDKTLYYVQAYEPDYYNLSGGIKNRILAYFSELSYTSNLYTVVNGKTYLKYKKLTASKIIYPGIDFNLFYPEKNKQLFISQREIKIGTIGRLENYKGTRYAVTAFRSLKKKFPGLQLYVAFGNPDDFKKEPDILCLQPHGDKELGNFYRSLDYYFCAGYTQLGAFHYPVAEAMSCGIPVITTNYYPADQTNAWIIPPMNSDGFITAFESAESHPLLRERKREKGLKDVRQFDWAAAGNCLNQYIKELAGKGADIRNDTLSGFIAKK